MADQKTYFVYILTNDTHNVLYTGVTGNLTQRMNQHADGQSTFTARYHVHRLVYVEEFQRVEDTIAREKQIKGGSRKSKFALVNSINPEWKDLMDM